jgi:hypothetical protein
MNLMVLLGRTTGSLYLGNKKPDSLEPKKAGLTGSTKWGHQRKAVALIQTTPRQGKFSPGIKISKYFCH